ncbi:MAG: GrpB family protein, partial [Mobilitalea sp.]
MRQDFSNVSGEKFIKLFPILLDEHNKEWREGYQKEKEFLQAVFGDNLVRISHIGSSAVEGLIAKPTIDILLEVSDDIDIQTITERMKDEGYVINTPKSDIIMYLKGYTPKGFEGQVVHIHVRYSGDWGELYFRDYLRTHPEATAEYAELKIILKEQYTYDRDGYTEAKGEFVRKYTQK